MKGPDTVISTVVMLVAAVACFGLACYSRALIGIITSGTMLAAMGDHAITQQVAPVVWVGLLLISGLVLAVHRRFSPQPAKAARSQRFSAAGATDWGAGAAVLSAVAFPIMAWFMLSHQGGGAPAGSGMHTLGHSSDFRMVDFAVLTVTVGVAASLVLISVASVRQKRLLLGADSGGMGVMLFATAIPAIPAIAG